MGGFKCRDWWGTAHYSSFVYQQYIKMWLGLMNPRLSACSSICCTCRTARSQRESGAAIIRSCVQSVHRWLPADLGLCLCSASKWKHLPAVKTGCGYIILEFNQTKATSCNATILIGHLNVSKSEAKNKATKCAVAAAEWIVHCCTFGLHLNITHKSSLECKKQRSSILLFLLTFAQTWHFQKAIKI